METGQLGLVTQETKALEGETLLVIRISAIRAKVTLGPNMVYKVFKTEQPLQIISPTEE